MAGEHVIGALVIAVIVLALAIVGLVAALGMTPVVVEVPGQVRETVVERGPTAVAPVRAVQFIPIRLVSGSGRKTLQRIEIPAVARRPTIVRERAVYQASHEDAEGWVYRHVGTERA